MDDIYIVTGVRGHLGSTIVTDLVKMGKKVRGFDLKNVFHDNLTEKIDMVYGDITNYDDVERLFAIKAKNIYVIHCAAIVSISSFKDKRIYNVNVNGVKNIVDCAIHHNVKKFVHVSSVHAIPEGKKGDVITEIYDFDPQKVKGVYAKTKALGTKYVLESVKRGLDVTVVHPSGIIGPNDYGNNHLTRLFVDYLNGKLKANVEGGYNFVDVRDVSLGTIQALFKGKKGKCYILSNRYATIEELLNMIAKITKQKAVKMISIKKAKKVAFLAEVYCKLKKIPPLFTSYSLYTLTANANFSHKLATKELDYHPRDLEQTIKDTVLFIQKHKIK